MTIQSKGGGKPASNPHASVCRTRLQCDMIDPVINKPSVIACICGILAAGVAPAGCKSSQPTAPGGPEIRLSQVTAYRYQGENLESVANAGEAVLSPDGSRADLTDGTVNVVESELTVSSPSVDVDLTTAAASGTDGVTAAGPGYSLSGERFELDGEEATLAMSGSVKATDREDPPAVEDGGKPGEPEAEPKEPASGSPGEKVSRDPVEIDADQVILKRATNQAVFTGNVVVIRGDYRMTSRKLTVSYGDNHRITHLLSEGDVRVTEAGRVATSNRAEFDTVEEVLTMIGDAVITEGDNVIHGDRVVFDIRADELRVEKVRARVRMEDLEEATGD